MFGAVKGIRTLDLLITSQLLYQLSYRGISSRCCSLIMATTKGLEPSTSGVTGRRSNQLNYDPSIFVVGETGIEPVTLGL